MNGKISKYKNLDLFQMKILIMENFLMDLMNYYLVTALFAFIFQLLIK
jgi:hypothetical protein